MTDKKWIDERQAQIDMAGSIREDAQALIEILSRHAATEDYETVMRAQTGILRLIEHGIALAEGRVKCPPNKPHLSILDGGKSGD